MRGPEEFQPHDDDCHHGEHGQLEEVVDQLSVFCTGAGTVCG